IPWQDAFPVLDGKTGALHGLILADAIRFLGSDRDSVRWTIAADLMQPAVTVSPDDDLHVATKALLTHGLREIPVVDANGQIVGFLDEAETARAYLEAIGKGDKPPIPAPVS